MDDLYHPCSKHLLISKKTSKSPISKQSPLITFEWLAYIIYALTLFQKIVKHAFTDAHNTVRKREVIGSEDSRRAHLL